MFLDTFNNFMCFPAVIFFVLRSQTFPSSIDRLAKALSQSSRTRNLSEHCHSFNELSQAEKNRMKDYLDETMSKVFKLGIPSFIKDS